ncbi:MAG: glutaredoxin 3 [Hyphomicrobiales bacterium]|nr:glutaredoxin 3 [Hyphomicrobiales bacterium]
MTEVTIYTRQLCGFCTAAKNLLTKKGVSFTEHDATFDPQLRNQMVSRAQGASTFPQIFIGDIHVGGCDDLMALEQAGNLDAMLKA